MTGQKLADESEVGLQVVRESNVLERPLRQLLPGVTDDVAQLLVDPQPAPLEPHMGDADGRLLEGGPEAFLALAQFLLGPFLLGDVADRGLEKHLSDQYAAAQEHGGWEHLAVEAPVRPLKE